MEVINAAHREKQNGAALILWTCRVGGQLGEAVAWCARLGLTFDAVNANLPERIAAYQNDCRKIDADEYWDDKAVVMGWVEASERDKILMDAVTTWGRDAQAMMMIEEMSELTKAISKFYRATDDSSASAAVESIREEMADVQIMLDQMKIMFGSPESYEREKLDRLRMRLEAAHGRSEQT